MKHKRFEENILVDEAYTNYGKSDPNQDQKKGSGIAKHFAESLEYAERKKWYHQLPEEPTTTDKTLNNDQIEELRKEASSALHGDTLAYETKTNRSGSSDQQWARTLLNKGAIGDRVAAATILIQDNPIYNLTALRNLVSNVKPAKKKDGIVIIDALSELFISELLLPEIKLRTFDQHSLGHIDEMTSGNKQARRNILKLWFFEDQLKELYGIYVEALNKFAHDSVDANKEKAVSSMSYLLMHHPEREKMLLNNIINKLGDPSQAVSSKVIYHLCQLLYNHPNMKGVVLNEIERMLFRSNISPRAQYYGICFLNQFFLGKDDSKIAENLIRIYFSFFKASIKKGDIDTRLMSAILTGVKRAYPFVDSERLASAGDHIAAVHRLVHLAKPSVAVHALALLFHVSAASEGSADRYYTALYRKLSQADIFNTNHSALLFSLIYKSLKQDGNTDRVTSFVKRLLQICCFMLPAQACGMLFLISQVLKDGKKKDAVKLVWSKREMKEEVKEEETEIQAEENAEANETLDTSADVEIKEDEEKTDNPKIDLLRGDKNDLLLDDDEETYVDLKIDDEGNVKPRKRRVGQVAGWHHAKVKVETESIEPEAADVKEANVKIQLKKAANMDKVINEYNPYVRNPSFAGATCSAYLELLPLSKHFHPTVKLFAEKLLTEQVIQYSGDPLKDFAGIRFLDRFVFKNPKKRAEVQEDGDVKKVKGSHPKFAIRKNYSAKGLKALPVTSTSYLNEDAKKIPVDEKFLYDFLQQRRAVRSEDSDSDSDSVTSEDFNKYLDSVTGGGGNDSDEELDYLAEMETAKQKRGAKKKGEESDDQLDDDDDDDDDVTGDGADFDDEIDGGLKALPVTSTSYLNEDAKKIPVDEKFLYDFLQQRRAVRSEDSDSDSDSVTSEDFNKYLDSVTGGGGNDSDEELDYLAEMETAKQKRGAKKKGEESDDQLDDDDDDDDDVTGDGADFDDEIDGDDEELDISGDEDEPALSGDEDELLLDNSDDEDTIDVPGKKLAKGKPKMKLKGKDDLGSLFASAEEFSTLLEDTATNKTQGSSQAVSNADNSSKKQLAWEEKRDRWIKGYNRKILGNKKAGKGKKFNTKPNKGNFNKTVDKKKGAKRKAGREDGAGGKRKKK